MKTTLGALYAMFLASTSALAEGYVPLLDHPQPGEGNEFHVAIEIPAGTFTKYEVDADTGHIIVDRFLSMPMVYPTNYGSITSSLGGDGDPLDALVYSREPVTPGAIIRVRAIGMLNMIDGGEKDSKIIAVPVTDSDPTYDAVKEISDLPPIEQQRLQAFFAVYKNLPEGSKKVEISGFDSATAAEAEVAAAIKAYSERK
ncbi:MAG: inorganic diphosphatase [Gemmobacter sp.]|jgi:inorganic pyrophosphatase|nr:inorganic diphosphatase [Gemmobacter sp.]